MDSTPAPACASRGRDSFIPSSTWPGWPAPFAAWALFANLLTPLAVVLMFVGEFLLRYRLHPEFERATLADAMTAYARRATAPA